MTTRPIITLTTDFGLTDPFVGVMKGVIASICPVAHVIDITHGVKAFDVLDGALAIWQASRYFPAETVHTIVVDPGVGSSRHPVLCRMGDAWFIAPDNGVLTLVEREVRRSGGLVSHRSIQNPAVHASRAKQHLPRPRYFCAGGRPSGCPDRARLCAAGNLWAGDRKPDSTGCAGADSSTRMGRSKASF